jgi:protein-tyrosine phosphatase
MVVTTLRRWWAGTPAGAEGPAPDTPSVLFVCMGNICRSPTAEGVLRARLAAVGLEAKVRVDSAGTLGHHAGEPPDPRARQHAAARGYAIDMQRARAVVPADFDRFDLILAMDQANLDWLERRAPAGSRARRALVMAWARRNEGVTEVPDPYYGPPAGFERVLDLLEDACDGLVTELQAMSADPGPGAASAGASGQA